MLLGVNSDGDRTALKKVMAEKQITWRSWWDGGNTGGPIASQYQVRSWPTIYVIDHQGTIRYKNVRGAAMDRAVEELVAKVEP